MLILYFLILCYMKCYIFMKTTNYCTIFRTDLLNGVYYLNTSNADLLLPTASSQLVHNWTFSFAENHFPQCRQFWADCEKTRSICGLKSICYIFYQRVVLGIKIELILVKNQNNFKLRINLFSSVYTVRWIRGLWFFLH